MQVALFLIVSNAVSDFDQYARFCTQSHFEAAVISFIEINYFITSALCSGAYSLSLLDFSQVEGERRPNIKHYRIKSLAVANSTVYFITARKKFATMQELVDHYTGTFAYSLFVPCFI